MGRRQVGSQADLRYHLQYCMKKRPRNLPRIPNLPGAPGDMASLDDANKNLNLSFVVRHVDVGIISSRALLFPLLSSLQLVPSRAVLQSLASCAYCLRLFFLKSHALPVPAEPIQHDQSKRTGDIPVVPPTAATHLPPAVVRQIHTAVPLHVHVVTASC